MTDFDQITKRLNRLTDDGRLTASERDYLLEPQASRSFTITYPNGDHDRTVDAYRVRFNDDRGPGKGGIRYHPGVDQDEVNALSFWMALKTSLADIPLGGAKGGVSVDPRGLTDEQIEIISREYIRGVHDIIGPDQDIPAPDVYTNASIMGIMVDEYETITGAHAPGVITGKPESLGGSKGRDTATATGAYYVLDKHLDDHATVAIQGFGNAGAQFAKLLDDNGHSVVAVSDSSGAIKDPTGLDVAAVKTVKESQGSVTDYDDASRVSNDDLLSLDVDVLAPAALGGVITEDNAATVSADTVIELANGPVTAEADRVLADNGITVIPDILANSGGVIVSYYEWVQNRTGEYWTAERVDTKLHEKITTNYDDLIDNTGEQTLRQAAYDIASSRILEAARSRGRL